MALDLSYEDEDVCSHGELYGEGAFSFKNMKPDSTTVSTPSDNNDDPNFDCNICLDTVQEPVVTFCGHLFCWPCIYKWLNVDSFSEYQSHRVCPVCKCKVSQSTLVPLYGRGRSNSQDKGKSNTNVPRRPVGRVYRLEMPNSPREGYRYHSSGVSYSAVLDPMMVMVGEMVAMRLFGTQFMYPDTYNLAEISGPRMRRRLMQADKSLGRIFFFFVCCASLCLFLF